MRERERSIAAARNVFVEVLGARSPHTREKCRNVHRVELRTQVAILPRMRSGTGSCV